MKYRRVLLITKLMDDARGAIAALRSLAPHAGYLVVVARLPALAFGWLSAEAPAGPGDGTDAAYAALRYNTTGAAPEVDIRLVPNLDIVALDAIAAASQVDLLAAEGSLPLQDVFMIAELRQRRSLPVFWIPQAARPVTGRPLRRLVCVAMGRRAGAAIAAFLRDHVDASNEVTILTSAARAESAAAREVAGVAAKLEVVSLPDGLASTWRDAGAGEADIDLAVFARFPIGLLASTVLSVPCLLLPPSPAEDWVSPRRGLDAPDIVDDGGPFRLCLQYATGVGRRTPIPDQEVAFVSNGGVVARVRTRGGEAQLPVHCRADAFGVFRTEGGDASDPLAAVEHLVCVIRPGSLPLVLFDADLADSELAMMQALAGRCDLLAVRIRATLSCASIRDRLAAAGLAARVADASLVLDEGEALDVPDTIDAVRLARVAARMRGAGFPVAAIVHNGPEHPDVTGFSVLRPQEVAAHDFPSGTPGPASLAARLDAATAPLVPGNRIEVELDNAKARAWLLAAIAASRERVHVQVYIAHDDDVGRRIENALAAAAARGVQVRMLVDSLYGLHGSFGARNPLLKRLGAVPGVELRLSRPVTGLPSLDDLKRRDHRKLVTVDGALAFLGGRNFAHEYYTGFEEVALTPLSIWSEVPWLDAGARVEGPAVAELERSFLAAWVEAGGATFPVACPPCAGSVPARVVVHHGLRDARTLETYLALIDGATSHVLVLTGFPLLLEIQHALLRAARRGVTVRVLFGQLTPTHAGGPFEGAWTVAHATATSFIHSRIDALVAAGCEAYQFSMPEQPSWARGLGAVRTYVHAKLMSVDGRVCAVGSANMDFTGGYWESELLLVIEDASVAGAVEGRIDALMADSLRVDKDDPHWRQLARSREWMRYWPSVLS
ncbi:phospholipase D-like domain-containing protein [Xanthobacter sediminis]